MLGGGSPLPYTYEFLGLLLHLEFEGIFVYFAITGLLVATVLVGKKNEILSMYKGKSHL